jgi:transcriptional regulator NrdR family protein
MQCGICGGSMKVTKVAHTPGFVRRRRKCQSCGKAWTTREFFDGAWLQEGGVVMPNSGGVDANG